MDPVIGSALIEGGANLLGNLLGWKSNKDTNKSNYDIAQMNNDFNERMLQKEMDYNTEMWRMQNEYNTPAAQRARYEAAGINPFMALGNIQSGQAGSAGGIKTPSAQPVTMQPFQPDFGGIGQAAQNYFANRLAQKRNDAAIAVDDEKANQLRIENQYKAAELTSQIYERIANSRHTDEKRIYQSIANNFAEQQFSQDVKYKDRMIQSIEADLKTKYVDLAIKDFQLAKLPEQYALQFASISADIAESFARRELTLKQASHEIQKELETIQRTNGLKIDNYKNRSTAESFIRKVYIEERKSRYPDNYLQLGLNAYEGFNKFVEKHIYKPSKRLWKDTKRSLGL